MSRWVLWPIAAIVVTVVCGIVSLGGLKKLWHGNHPVQAVTAMVFYGLVVGLLIAWAAEALFG